MLRKGTLKVTYADGSTRSYGDGTGTPIVVTVHDTQTERMLALTPESGLGEAYMHEGLTIADDDIEGLLRLSMENMELHGMPWYATAMNQYRRFLRWVEQNNPVGKAQSNVAHHYDLSGELYDLFLDSDKQYSCAYWPRPGMTLEEAQEAKKQHIARKLLIEPGMTVLDIGCGWGGMALTLARDFGAKVVGVTLSTEQHAVATRRAKEAGLDGQVEFRLTDYRNVQQQFDRVVSIGMFEHVGTPHYREYFRHVHDFLKPDGVALIHFIGRYDPPGVTNKWITKYIFPGGYCPSMSESAKAIEKEQLFIDDVEVWRLHYAETLKEWRARFEANLDRVRELYDDTFIRMWRFYLLASELTFRLRGQVVFQFQLSREQEAVPLSRDYLYRDDARALQQAAE